MWLGEMGQWKGMHLLVCFVFEGSYLVDLKSYSSLSAQELLLWELGELYGMSEKKARLAAC